MNVIDAVALGLPAVSISLTVTVLEPSVAVGGVVLHVVPPSVLYSIVLPASFGVTVSVPSLVIRSVALEPVSFVSSTLGAAGAVASTVTLPLPVPSLPAASVAVTSTVVTPSASVATTSSASVHVPSPLFVAV